MRLEFMYYLWPLFRVHSLHHANSRGSAFANPWSEEKESTFTEWQLPQFLTQGWAKFPFEWAKAHHGHPHKPVEVVDPEFKSKKFSENSEKIQATWLGHASFLVALPEDGASVGPVRILFDPIFSDRAGPSAWAGPRRAKPPPCRIDELPEFHFVVISHNHYDHLDLGSIEQIHATRGRMVQYVVPLGNKSWFTSLGIADDQVLEMDWWQDMTIAARCSDERDARDVKFICTPAQHNSGRGLMDQNATLWASWVIDFSVRRRGNSNEDTRVSLFFAGDTGYETQSGPCPIFKEIGEKYGPFDLAMLPIWRGGTLQFIARMGLKFTDHKLTSGVHATPEQAVWIHRDIKSRHSLAMHFATFAGSDIEAFEPIVELTEIRDNHSIGDWHAEGGFGVINIGETAMISIENSADEACSPSQD